MRRLSDHQTWPMLRLTVQLLPWHWRLRPYFYRDDVEGAWGMCSVAWLMVDLEWAANRPAFTEPKP